VYTFHGQEGDLPLYIGKSINLRARVLSHLRNPDEARMLRQTTRISCVRTAGEVGALLLEARMIKEQQPLFNQKLRRNRQLCSLRLGTLDAPELVYSRDINFASEPNLYGLFASRHSALEALRSLADKHGLCYGALGLEKLSTGRGCFRSMLNQCKGVCCGRESPQAHRARMLSALESMKVACWPFPGAIGLIEHWPPSSDADDAGTFTQIHVVRNWCYLGSVANPVEGQALDRVATAFDADGYKILCRPVLTGSLAVVNLAPGG
jgi:excinuclease Cho